MRLCIYGTKKDNRNVLSAFEELHSMVFRQIDSDSFDCYDELVKAIKQNKYDLAIIAMDNAEGMEGVIAVTSVFPEMPVIWFSNDGDFGAQSFRLNTAYFHEKPITAQILKNALEKCKLLC